MNLNVIMGNLSGAEVESFLDSFFQDKVFLKRIEDKYNASEYKINDSFAEFLEKYKETFKIVLESYLKNDNLDVFKFYFDESMIGYATLKKDGKKRIFNTVKFIGKYEDNENNLGEFLRHLVAQIEDVYCSLNVEELYYYYECVSSRELAVVLGESGYQSEEVSNITVFKKDLKNARAVAR